MVIILVALHQTRQSLAQCRLLVVVICRRDREPVRCTVLSEGRDERFSHNDEFSDDMPSFAIVVAEEEGANMLDQQTARTHRGAKRKTLVPDTVFSASFWHGKTKRLNAKLQAKKTPTKNRPATRKVGLAGAAVTAWAEASEH